MRYLTVGLEENPPNHNELGYMKLSDDELTEFSGDVNANLAKARSMHPAQLADVLHRIRSVNTVQCWNLFRDSELIGSSHPPVGASSTDAATHFDPTVAGGHLTLCANDVAESRLQPIETESRIDTRSDQAVRGGEDNSMGHESEAILSAVQGTSQAQERSFTRASYYLTPPANSPRKRRRIASASPHPCHNSQMSPDEPSLEASPNPIHNGPSATNSDRAVCLLRRACKIGEEGQCLEERHLEQVLRLSARLISRDPDVVLRSHLDSWSYNVSQGLHALGLPTVWKGVEAVAIYVSLLRNGQIRDAVGQRAARMLLVLNYEEICKCPERYCPRRRRPKEKRTAYVMDCITQAYLNHLSRKPSKPDRDAIHNYLRQGRWLWTLAGKVGMGIVLTCDDALMSAIKNVSVCNDRIDAIATYAFYTRPGTVRLLHSLESVVKPLMLGQVSADLVEAIKVDGSGILGPSALSLVRKEDQAALADQHAVECWPPIDLKSAVSQKKADFLGNDPETNPTVGPTPSDGSVVATPLDYIPGDDTVVTSLLEQNTGDDTLINSLDYQFADDVLLDFPVDNLDLGE